MARFIVALNRIQSASSTSTATVSVEAPCKEAIGKNLESMIQDIENKVPGENLESMIEGIRSIDWEIVEGAVTTTSVEITGIVEDDEPENEPDIDLTLLPARFPMARFSESLSERQNEGCLRSTEDSIYTFPIDLDIKIRTLGTVLGKPSDQGPAELLLMADGLNGRISCLWDTGTDSVKLTVCTTLAMKAYDLLTQDKYKGKAQRIEIDKSKFTLYEVHITNFADPGIMTLITDCIPLIR